MAETEKDQPKLTSKQRFAAMFRIAKISYRAAPSVLYIRLVSSILDSVLPIITTYYAAQTTTELARAYSGQEGAGEAAIMYVILTALLGVIMTAWSSIERYVSRFARYKLETSISNQLSTQFLSLEYWRYDDKKTADLFDKSRQFSNFFTYIFDSIGNIVTAVITLISSLIALMFVSWWLALILFIAVTPGLYIQYRLSKDRIKQWNKNVDVRRKASNINWTLTDIRHIAELRIYGLVKYLMNLRQDYRDQDEKQQILIERGYIWKELVASVIEAVAEVVALVYITLKIIAHAQPVGQFLFVQQMVSRGLGSMRQVAQSFINMDEDIANLSAYNEFISLPVADRRPKRLKQSPGRIEFKEVSFHYPSVEKAVLEDISFSIQPGQHIAIVGENGAGKSTLVKLLLGLYSPTKGKVLLDDEDMETISLESWHKNVAVLQQSFAIFDFATARENIMYGDVSRPKSTGRYNAATNAAEAKTFLSELPKKDDNYITQWMEHPDGTSGVALSGGQEQRLALARNFYRDSPVVILDEPTSAIDALAESRIFKRIFEDKKKMIVTISHRLSTVRRADIIYVLEHGRIVEKGKHAQLVKNKGEYYKIFESQLDTGEV
ncbi:MAG: ABC transporter ATP-binding protein [Candidatus Microsaccharimonas sp.]